MKKLLSIITLLSLAAMAYDVPQTVELNGIPNHTPAKISFSYHTESKTYSVRIKSKSVDFSRTEMEKFVAALRKTVEWDKIAKDNKANVSKAAYASPQDSEENSMLVAFWSQKEGERRAVFIGIGPRQYYILCENTASDIEKAVEILGVIGDLDAIERAADAEEKKADALFK